MIMINVFFIHFIYNCMYLYLCAINLCDLGTCNGWLLDVHGKLVTGAHGISKDHLYSYQAE